MASIRILFIAVLQFQACFHYSMEDAYSIGNFVDASKFGTVAAMVNVPESRKLRIGNMNDRPQQQTTIRVEYQPLIGGPKWLPIHSVVTATTDDGVKQSWDFIPKDATNPQTLLRLLTFQSVPGIARYRRSKVQEIRNQRMEMETATSVDRANVFANAGFDIVIDTAGTSSNDSRNSDEIDAGSDVIVRNITGIASTFCDDADTDLHLLHNNCWTFSSLLYNELA